MPVHPPSFFKPDLPPDALYHVGISGGKDSAATLIWIVRESGIPPENIDATFCDTGNEHQWTLDHVEYLSTHVHKIHTLLPQRSYYELALHKHRFPSQRARFCTTELKIKTTQRHLSQLMKTGRKVVCVSGVRADESEDRSLLEEWDYSNALLALQWRPLIRWTLQDVKHLHQKHGIPLNPLYAAGASRVGCWPCFMCQKQEIRIIATKFPERIDFIRAKEQEFEEKLGRASSFFAYDKVPERFRSRECQTKDGRTVKVATIDDVVRWALTGKNAKGSYLDDPEPDPDRCMSGFCE